jgi:hypothetical protein
MIITFFFLVVVVADKLFSNTSGETFLQYWWRKKNALRLFSFSILLEKKKMHGFGFDYRASLS